MNKKWQVKKTDSDTVAQLQLDLGIAKSLCTVLAARQITSFEKSRDYFRPSLEQLHDPMLMKDMAAAVARVVKAINEKQRILVYGDYDVDGTTAVGVMCHFLRHFTSHVDYYIPNRFTEGYGVSEQGMAYAASQKIDLVITLDCGIKNTSLLSRVQASGIDVIICDHHLPDVEVPNVVAILNPKQIDCNYPYKELCGCGVGYKLMCAVENALASTQEICNTHLDLVATAIAADIVPMTGENRIIAYHGLQKANNNPCIALQALKTIAALNKAYTIADLVFIVAPRVNAAGRMQDGKLAVDLFLSTQLSHAKELAAQININNDDRKDIDKQMTAEALEMLMQLPPHTRGTVLYNPEWHSGVVGIVASRMIEQKHQPTIILTKLEGKLKGSARSIPGVNLFEALHECRENLEAFGGHYFAAGLTLQENQLDNFSKKFDEVVKKALPNDSDFDPIVHIDAELNFAEATMRFHSIIDQMEPYGPENLRPVFVTHGVTNFQNKSSIVKEKHLRVIVQHNGTVMKGIGFSMAELYPIVACNQPFSMCYTLELNTWNNITNVELRIIDIKATD